MVDFGLTPAGFLQKQFSDIRADIVSGLKAAIGDSALADLDESVMGIVDALLAKPSAELWKLAADLYAAFDPNSANDTAQDRLCSLTGVRRLGPKQSVTSGVAIGTDGTSLASGVRIRNRVTNTYWVSTAISTISTLSSWGATTDYVVGDLVQHDTGKVYSCTAKGTSAGSGGPTGTATIITDGSVTWRYCGAGTAASSVPFSAQDTGPIIGAAGDLSVIDTTIGGWTSIVNPLDATIGRNRETNPELRLRRAQELRNQGGAAVDAIRAALLELKDVTAAEVFENDTDDADSDGLPRHSIECMALGGDDQTILNTVWLKKAGGIQPYGTTSGTVIDSKGNARTVKFTRPTAKDVYVIVNLTKDATKWPTDGVTQVQEALAEFGDARFGIGDDVIDSALAVPVFGISGVTDVTSILIGFSPSPAFSSNLPVSIREISQFDTSRIVVNAT